MRGMDIKQLVADFTERLHALVDEISVARAREAVMHALGERRGRLPRGLAALIGRKPRRKGPRQLCPVPGCTNPAAPVFGMVCAEHKDVSKTKIKQYREARRAAKLGARKGAKDGQNGGKPVDKKIGKPAGKNEGRAKGATKGMTKGATTAPRARPSKRAPRLASPAPKKPARPARTPGIGTPVKASAPAPAAESPSVSLAN